MSGEVASPPSTANSKQEESTSPNAPGTANTDNQGATASSRERGSQANLAGTLSRKGSVRILNKAAPPPAGPSQPAPGEAAPPTNAIVYENTYKLKPDRLCVCTNVSATAGADRFGTELVRKIAAEQLTKQLTKVKYSPDKVPELCKSIANEILVSVKKEAGERAAQEHRFAGFGHVGAVAPPRLHLTAFRMVLQAELEFERYKFVVDVTIGEFKGQGIRVASRAVWDATTDSYASASFRNATLFAVAMVFGCYYE
ncbi:Tctex-1 family-domain-containing protein [Polychytrium aggregatum]|uniref:Tctex-1 family-domain-containing protein n=1 Tax=Polychytrium aggregatum TaxID=110093 RepID=UPI0022FE8E4C|nr:Tctex-1 family-domain-containing protein [Polychytrium aggregatum]KAI9190756.1 Tctex-1 family-domain-containing protein [Polychytrium aggregatum]